MMPVLLDIAEVAVRSGLAPSALRFYEKRGLIAPAGRNGLRRTYQPEVLDRLALIGCARGAGFTIAEIGRFLAATPSDTELRAKMAAKAEALEEDIARLSRMRDSLRHASTCPHEPLVECPDFKRTFKDSVPAALSTSALPGPRSSSSKLGTQLASRSYRGAHVAAKRSKFAVYVGNCAKLSALVFFCFICGRDMRTLRKLAVAFVVAGIAGASAATPVFADTAASTGFGFSQDNQGFYNYTDQTITLSGTLWDTAVTPNTTIADEPVTVTEQVAGTGTAEDVGSATTDANGNFTVTLTDQPVGGIFEAVFAGDTANGNDYDATTSLPVKVQPQFPSDVDVAYTKPPKSPVKAGGTVKFAGTVYVPADDQGGTNPQTPIVGANVYVFTGSEYTSTSPHAVTNAKGKFSISVKPSVTTTYTTEVVSSVPWPYSLYVSETILAQTTITVNPK